MDFTCIQKIGGKAVKQIICMCLPFQFLHNYFHFPQATLSTDGIMFVSTTTVQFMYHCLTCQKYQKNVWPMWALFVSKAAAQIYPFCWRKCRMFIHERNFFTATFSASLRYALTYYIHHQDTITHWLTDEMQKVGKGGNIYWSTAAINFYFAHYCIHSDDDTAVKLFKWIPLLCKKAIQSVHLVCQRGTRKARYICAYFQFVRKRRYLPCKKWWEWFFSDKWGTHTKK